MKTNSIGTNADISAGVDISKVHGNYFADPKNIERFIDLGIKPIIKDFPKKMNYVDFGGGQGHLTILVKEYLEKNSFNVSATVADANENYLLTAKEKSLDTRLCNLEDAPFSNTDLITMRAVLHYNVPDNQKLILKNVFNALKIGGYFVHQNSSGNKENCELRSALVNIPELGRAGAGDYHWISEQEYRFLIEGAGFSTTTIVGYAQPNSWGPDEQWDRFNDKITKIATENKDEETLRDIETRKKIYLDKAYAMIREYSEKYGKEYLGAKDLDDGKIVIEYLYPIIVSRK
jgi:SAM-dependent methyltransferase